MALKQVAVCDNCGKQHDEYHEWWTCTSRTIGRSTIPSALTVEPELWDKDGSVHLCSQSCLLHHVQQTISKMVSKEPATRPAEAPTP